MTKQELKNINAALRDQVVHLGITQPKELLSKATNAFIEAENKAMSIAIVDCKQLARIVTDDAAAERYTNRLNHLERFSLMPRTKIAKLRRRIGSNQVHPASLFARKAMR